MIIFSVSLSFAQEKNNPADLLFKKMEYAKAAQLYEKEIINGDESLQVYQKIANSHYFNTNMKEANKWYGKLITKYSKTADAASIFRYAKSFQGIGKYAAAKKWMKKYNERVNQKTQINSNTKEQELSKILTQEQEFTLNNLSINTVFSDFGPMYYGTKLIYASAVDSTYYQTNNYHWNQQPFLNLYIGSINNKTNDIENSKPFSKNLNSKFNEATLTFSKDLKKVYYTRNNYNNNWNTKNGEVNRLKLYSATATTKKDGTIVWGNAKELPFNSDEYSVGHPALSHDGTKLYFVSDMPGTIGATDIFVVDILDEDTYSNPRNLGTTINTTAKEMFPFVTSDKLYFSSNGHLGLGGLDVFESDLGEIIGNPKNLGAPLNSILDDFGYIINADTNTGFVCSNRNSGKGDDDIYFFEREIPGECTQQITGYISNNLTGEKIKDAKLILKNKNGDILEKTATITNGEYEFKSSINCNQTYTIEVSKVGYTTKNKSVLTSKKRGKTNVPIGIDIINELIVEENGLLKIKIGTIYFDLDKAIIRKDAAIEFDKVIKLMKLYPKMTIKIASHTDSRANDNYNLKLSDRRAKATRDYIISKGINPNRIISAKGYGETQLMNGCKNGVPCSDAMHQLNRRSEFIIIKM